MKYRLTSVFTKEKKGYSALCPELGVASQGETFEDAKNNIKEAVELFVEDLKQKDLRDLISRTRVNTLVIDHA